MSSPLAPADHPHDRSHLSHCPASASANIISYHYCQFEDRYIIASELTVILSPPITYEDNLSEGKLDLLK